MRVLVRTTASIDRSTHGFDADAWRKSSRSSGNDNCVEVAIGNSGTVVRDSKFGAASPVLAFGHGAFARFLGAVKGGRFGR
ncbi:DUF397 domain-containing protein [Saccharopolyspora sp. NPDC047091]|uniref:DUF397 domain-containing protein n=1 Tax=Saccharopolyspora sp. NPDC047091 TaxID=3155924 RepID=UPI0033C6CB83